MYTTQLTAQPCQCPVPAPPSQQAARFRAPTCSGPSLSASLSSQAHASSATFEICFRHYHLRPPFELTLTGSFLGTHARMEALAMETIDTSRAMLPDKDHSLHVFCYRPPITMPPRGSRRCQSCFSLYYRDSEGCLRVVPGPGPSLSPGGKRTTSVRRLCLHSGFCTICRLLCGLIAGLPGRFEEIELKTSPNHACSVKVAGGQDEVFLFPERDIQEFDFKLGSKTSRASHIDPDLISGWIEICETNHNSGDNPARMSRLKDPIDITLIDVVDQRLVYGSSSMPFCALSYVWGGVEGFRTTTANRAALELPGSLQQPQVSSQIPQTIKDAMRLVSLIGERFLWVDALCIQQDNSAMKRNQIMQMDIIYGHAMLTIVNLSGENADAPLPRVPSEEDVLIKTASTGTSMRQQADQVNRTGLVPVGCDINSTIESSTYDTRAWAFQERLLSQRCLFLGEYQCFFLCHTHLQAELPCRTGRMDALNILPGRNISPRSWFIDISPNSSALNQTMHFVHFQNLLRVYRMKTLSWESDTLNAFSGILSALTEQSGWTFLSGLPEQHLEFGLLWIPGDPGPVRRIAGFPTWSWAAWDCIPEWDQTDMLSNSLPLSSTHEVRSEIDGLQTFRQTPRRSISSEPSVSTRTSYPSDAWAGLDVLAFHAYTVPYKSFSLTPWNSEQVPSILDFDGRSCGVRCRSSKATEATNKDRIDTQMEIVLLSRFRRMRERRLLYDYVITFHEPEYPFSEWAFLNVMFIRWEGGHAERVCIGVMHERAFMKAGPTWKEILLM